MKVLKNIFGQVLATVSGVVRLSVITRRNDEIIYDLIGRINTLFRLLRDARNDLGLRLSLVLSFLVILSAVEGYTQEMSINPTGAKPDPSAMLDVSSTQKGVLIPRVTRTQRNAIASPATGLLVFMTTDTVGFFFFNGNKWEQVGNANSLKSGDSSRLADADNDTKIQVEASVDSDEIVLSTAGSARMTIDNSGNIGIGTTTPTQALNLNGNGKEILFTGNGTVASSINSDNSLNLEIDGNNNGTGSEFKVISNGSASTPLIYSDEDGNIGFGTETPATRFHIEGSAYQQQTIKSTGSGATLILDGQSGQQMSTVLRTNSSNNWIVGMDNAPAGNAGDYSIKTTNNANPEFVFTDDGNLGINNNDPQHELDVGGTIMTDSLAIYNSYGFPSKNGSNGQILQHNGTRLVWANPSSATSDEIADADNDTKIQMEENSDEDLIRIDLGGTEYFRLEQGRINIQNSNNNVSIGKSAGSSLTAGSSNTFVGAEAGANSANQNNNTLIGYRAGYISTGGTGNTVVGSLAGDAITTGDNNVLMGVQSGSGLNTGQNNVFLGKNSGRINSSGSQNTYIGTDAGDVNNGTANVFIGNSAGAQQTTASNLLFIDNTNTNAPLIWGDFANDSVQVNGNLEATNGAYISVSDNSNDDAFYAVNRNDANNSKFAVRGQTWQESAAATNPLYGGWFQSRSFSSSTQEVYGVFSDVRHNGTSGGNAYGAYITMSGSTSGDEYGVYTTGEDMNYFSNNVGIGTSSPSTNLHVVGSIRMVDGNEAAGRVLTSDANGVASWSVPSSSAVSLADADNDTKILVEETTDKDRITLIAAGDTAAIFKGDSLLIGSGFNINAGGNFKFGGTGIDITNDGYDLFIGEGISEISYSGSVRIGDSIGQGASSVALGHFSLHSGGAHNVAIGNYALRSLVSGQQNAVIGNSALNKANGASENTVVGFEGGNNNITGDGNTLLGWRSGYNNLGSQNVFIGYSSGFNETGSNKLYIENSNSATPLIYGDFTADSLATNGSFTVLAPDGSDAILKIQADRDNNNENENPQLWLEQDGGGTKAMIGIEGEDGVTLNGGKDNSLLIGTFNDEEIQFFVNGDPKMIIDNESTGKAEVGIGTRSPGYNLHVVDSSGNGSFRLQGVGAGAHAYMYLRNDLTGYTIENNGSSGRLLFENYQEDVILSLDSTRRVGIGTGFPSYDLDIRNDNSDAQLRLRTTNSTDDAEIKLRTNMQTYDIKNEGSNGKLIFQNEAGDDLLTLDSLGNFGIGTTSPTELLTVGKGGGTPTVGSTSTLITKSGTNALTVMNSSASTEAFMYAGTQNVNIGSASKDRLNLHTGNTVRLSIDTLGNVGIGTNEPEAQLTVENTTNAIIRANTFASTLAETSVLNLVKSRGSSSSPAIVVNGDNIGRINGFAYDGTSIKTAAKIEFAVDGTPGTDDMPGRIQFHTTPDGANSTTERMRITNDGKIGVGTTAPEEVLDVSGNMAMFNSNSYATDRYLYSQWTDATNDHSIGLEFDYYTGTNTNNITHSRINFVSNAEDDEKIYDAGKQTTMSILSSGNVGIGTISPSERLEVSGNIEIPAANEFKYGSAKSCTLAVPASSFVLHHKNTGLEVFRGSAGNMVYIIGGSISNDAEFYAPINLPDGAIVTQVDFFLRDNSATIEVFGELIEQAQGGSYAATMATTTKTGIAFLSSGVQTESTTTISNATIDNSNRAYYLRFNTYEGTPLPRCYGARIVYTKTTVD